MSEIRELNDEITNVEKQYWELKYDYEQQKAKLLLETDWATEMGKAKPTVAEKDAYIEQVLGDFRLDYRLVRTQLDRLKRLFQVMLKELGDDE